MENPFFPFCFQTIKDCILLLHQVIFRTAPPGIFAEYRVFIVA